MVNGEYEDGEDKFLNSLNDEIMNAYKEQFNYLTFIGTLTIREFFKLKRDPRKVTLTFDKQHYCGFFDPYNGGGSIFSIDLPHQITFRGDSVHLLMVEGGSKKYTVDSVYGMTSSCFQPIKLN